MDGGKVFISSTKNDDKTFLGRIVAYPDFQQTSFPEFKFGKILSISYDQNKFLFSDQIRDFNDPTSTGQKYAHIADLSTGKISAPIPAKNGINFTFSSDGLFVDSNYNHTEFDIVDATTGLRKKRFAGHQFYFSKDHSHFFYIENCKIILASTAQPDLTNIIKLPNEVKCPTDNYNFVYQTIQISNDGNHIALSGPARVGAPMFYSNLTQKWSNLQEYANTIEPGYVGDAIILNKKKSIVITLRTGKLVVVPMSDIR